MSAPNVVIVESPAKAKTINKYLGKDYTVLASYGHVRDLPSKNGSVLPEEDFKMAWDIDPQSNKRLKDIASAVKGAEKLILATDPDREGEAISWHVLEVLNGKKALKGVDVERVVFNAITKAMAAMSAEERFAALVETHGMSDEDLGAWCRRHGLHSHELAQWRRDALAGAAPVADSSEGRAQTKRLRQENAALRKELNRKDKALAETTALLVLQKKARLLWGEDEER